MRVTICLRYREKVGKPEKKKPGVPYCPACGGIHTYLYIHQYASIPVRGLTKPVYITDGYRGDLWRCKDCKYTFEIK